MILAIGIVVLALILLLIFFKTSEKALRASDNSNYVICICGCRNSFKNWTCKNCKRPLY
jgi:hypothetical protein